MRKPINLIGQRFGSLVVVSRAEDSKGGFSRWNCLCDCGGTTIAFGGNLRRGNTKSCGCLKMEMCTTHGMARILTYKIWANMLQRCANSNNHSYKNYGGRGITVCDRWLDFENFYTDMGERPKRFSVERKDNNGNYCPENCCWETMKTQARNRRRNRIIKYDGKEQCLAAWAEELCINYATLWNRLQRHTPQIAFNM